MTDGITIVIEGPPRAKARPRPFVMPGTRRVGFARDKATDEYERRIGFHARLAMGTRPMFSGPVAVAVTVQVEPPASWPIRRRERAIAGLELPTGRPDMDNYVKAALDGLMPIAFEDDAIVVRLVAMKRYGQPRMAIAIEPIVLQAAAPLLGEAA